MKRMILVLTAALLLTAMMVAAAPAFAQEQKKDEKKDEKKEKDLPQSGGIPVNPALLSLDAGALLVGGGLVAVRVSRRRQ